MQLFSNSIPYLQELKKDGQAGRNQITQYTRYGTVVLAFVQASALAVTLGASGLAYEPGPSFFISAVCQCSSRNNLFNVAWRTNFRARYW
jgi:preprotein translocase subunit SecY